MKTAVPRLALDGGPRVRTKPMPVRLQFGSREREAIDALFREAERDGGDFDRYGPGPQAAGTTLARKIGSPSEVDYYEQELARYYGVRFVTALSSGSGAVLAALAALELEPGREVITSPLTDPGVVMAALFLGLPVVFVDHEYDTIGVDPTDIESAMSSHTGAIIVTHLMGMVSDMDRIMGIARRRGVPVIGDSAQAHGATYHGSRARPFGDIGAVSTMSTKHMTSGGQGGFVATDNEHYYWAAKRFADRGKPFGLPEPPAGAPHGGDRQTFGLNLRMHDLEAAIGRVQLAKLPDVMSARLAILDRLDAGVANIEGVRAVRRYAGTSPNPWAAVFLLDRSFIDADVRRFSSAMTAEGIATVPMIPDMVPVIDELSFMLAQTDERKRSYPYGHVLHGRRVVYAPRAHPVIDRLARDLMLIWIHEGWGQEEVDDTLAALRKVSAAMRAD